MLRVPLLGWAVVLSFTREAKAFLVQPARLHLRTTSTLVTDRHSDRRSSSSNRHILNMGKGKANRKKLHKALLQEENEDGSGPCTSKLVDAKDSVGAAVSGQEDADVPALVVMDLDYTLWRPELYQMSGSPFTKKKDGKVRDRSGTVIDLFPGVREILLAVYKEDRFRDTELAIASRTSHKSWANEVMGLIELEPGVLMRNVFSCSQIYTGSKVRHFGEIRKSSSVPYEDMIFFDDWDQNCKEVGSLGVTCVECRRGLNEGVWSRGLKTFADVKKNMRP